MGLTSVDSLLAKTTPAAIVHTMQLEDGSGRTKDVQTRWVDTSTKIDAPIEQFGSYVKDAGAVFAIAAGPPGVGCVPDSIRTMLTDGLTRAIANSTTLSEAETDAGRMRASVSPPSASHTGSTCLTKMAGRMSPR